MLGRSRFALALAWLLSFSCQSSSSYRAGTPDGAAGQGGHATGNGSATDAGAGENTVGPDAGASTGGSTGIATTATTGVGGTGGMGGGGSGASPDAGGNAAAGADGAASSDPDANARDGRDASAETADDAPLVGGDASLGGATAGHSGSIADAGGGTRADAGLGGTAGGRSEDAASSPRGGAGASGSFDAADAARLSSDPTTFSVPETPVRAVDLLFVIDNSPSMDPKQRVLAAGFPALMNALQALPTGLPDLHVGVISTDLGAGQGEAGGNCQYVLGNQGILWGNDPAVDSKSQGNKYATTKDVTSSVGNPGCGMDSEARWIEDVQNSTGLGRSKNYLGNLTDVFSCLTSAVGVGGCGYEHPLQSLRLALNPQQSLNPQNTGFLRRNAYLAIVIVTDEDDCSADPNSDLNDGMFFPRTLGDTASLRCAARGHVCRGLPIPDYDPSTGYTGSAPFVASFEDCDAKDDPDHHNLPLIRVGEFIDSVKQVKDRPDEQILVSGIIGWPRNSDLIGVQYRIDKDLTSIPIDQQKLWDIMPICTLPEFKSADGNIYKAYGGLRLKRFIDGFGANGRTYSICESDLAPVMTELGNRIGNAVNQKLWPACVPNPLMDGNLALSGLQPDCVIKEGQPCDTPGSGQCLSTGYQESAIAQCLDVNGNHLNPNDPNLMSIPDDDAHRPCWYLAYDTDPNTGCPHAPHGQRISILRRAGAIPNGSILSLSCRTCPSADDPRCAAP